MNFSSISALPQGVVSFIREARQELKSVQWPTRRDTIRYTAVILIVSILVGASIGLFDYGLTLFIQRIVQ